MKELGSSSNGGVIVELDKSEYHALLRLVEACGDDPDIQGSPLITAKPITPWLRAVRLFAREISAVKDARQLLEQVEATLMPEEQERTA